MNSAETTQVLNRLLILHNRSLPMYLGYASPLLQEAGRAAKEALDQIVADHQATVDRLGEMIVDSGAGVSFGEFPLRFASLHDLTFEYILTKLIEHQKRLIAAISECAAQVRTAPTAQAVALEALGQAKAHLQSLEELAHRPAAAAAT
jgi:hypothetical protein